MGTPQNGLKKSIQVYYNVIEATNIRGMEKDGKSDPYVTISRLLNFKKVEIAQTHHIVLTSHPQWWYDGIVDMGDAPTDLIFKMYDWNKVLNDRRIGKTFLSYSTITPAGSFHKLDLGRDKGALLVFAKVFYSTGYEMNVMHQAGPSTRLLFDPTQRQTVRPGELMRAGYVLRVKQPLTLSSLNFEITQHYNPDKPHLQGNAVQNIKPRSWSASLSVLQPERLTSKEEVGASHPLNSKYLPYGDNSNSLPKTLCAGIHYFHIEFSFPSRDSCGRFIGSGGSEDVETLFKCSVVLADPKVDTIGKPGSMLRPNSAPLFTKSNYHLHLKPALPPIFTTPEISEELLWQENIKLTWSVPYEGRNLKSPLPSRLCNSEDIMDKELTGWFIAEGEDILDAHGQERLYANLYWANGGEAGVQRRDSPHFLVLSELAIDDSAAQAALGACELKIAYTVQLVCDRFTLSRVDETCTARNQFIYNLKPTNKNVGNGKREYEIVRGAASPPELIYSLPSEMYGHFATSYVYIEVVAINTANPSQTWVLQRRPFFVDAFSNNTPPRTPMEPANPTGLFNVSYTHYPFIDRANEEPLSHDSDDEDKKPRRPNKDYVFGRDRLVRLMVPASGPDRGFIDESNLARDDGPIGFSAALATPQEAKHFEFTQVGVPIYIQHKSMDEPANALPLQIKVSHTHK